MAIILTTGLPASGKSTWARAQVLNSDGKIVRVSMDDIRSMVGLPYSTGAENIALKMQDQFIVSAVKQGKDVIVDNTHIEKKMPNRYKKLFDGDVEFQIKSFRDVPLEECIKRDKSRFLGHVGEQVIKRMYNRMQTNKFDLTYEYMNDMVLSPPLIFDKDLPDTVVFDIDGTLAEHIARSPYDYTRVGTDGVFQHIARLTRMYDDYGFHVMIMSGRPGSLEVRKDTINWLLANGIYFDELHMRGEDLPNPESDKRNDTVVKMEMVDKHIRGKYNVEHWFDDRDRVVRILRKLGIKVSQVADGDF